MNAMLPAAHVAADALLGLARASVHVTGSGSVARLQQDLGLGFALASALALRLEDEGTLLPAHGERARMLHPRFQQQTVRDVSAAPRPRYVNRLVALALFYFECFEEGHAGDSRIPKLLSPVTGVTVKTLRALFLARWYRDEGMSLVQAALAFHAHLVDAGLTDLTEAAMREAIAVACVPYARKFVQQLTLEERIDRAHLRLARCYRHMLADGINRESRVIEWYVPAQFVARGISTMRQACGLADGAHTEHVVPCAFIRDTALRYLDEGRSLDEVVRMTRRFLAIVDITGSERAKLDDGAQALRHVMPAAWDVDSGCIYARLHAKQIDFAPPVKFACDCGAVAACDARLISCGDAD